MRVNTWSPLVSRNLYSSPAFAPLTNPYQNPLPSDASRSASSAQSLKWPITLTVFALGAHTRKPTPSDDTIAPMPSSRGSVTAALLVAFFADAFCLPAFFEAEVLGLVALAFCLVFFAGAVMSDVALPEGCLAGVMRVNLPACRRG